MEQPRTPESEELVRLLRVAHRATQHSLSRSQNVTGLTAEDGETLSVLARLGDAGTVTPAVLASICSVTRAAMTSRLDRLVRAGLVSRETDLDDRRRVAVKLTAHGVALLQEQKSVVARHALEAVSALTPQDLADLIALLRKVVNGAD